MHVGLHKSQHQYTTRGKIIQAMKVERDIGVDITDNLKRGRHCSEAARTAQTVLGQLSRLSSTIIAPCLSRFTNNM
jgi:hypothetical protein